jgi:hypothetical protein
VSQVNGSFQVISCEVFGSLAGIEFADPEVDCVGSSLNCAEQGFVIAYRGKDFRRIAGEIFVRHIRSGDILFR